MVRLRNPSSENPWTRMDDADDVLPGRRRRHRRRLPLWRWKSLRDRCHFGRGDDDCHTSRIDLDAGALPAHGTRRVRLPIVVS